MLKLQDFFFTFYFKLVYSIFFFSESNQLLDLKIIQLPKLVSKPIVSTSSMVEENSSVALRIYTQQGYYFEPFERIPIRTGLKLILPKGYMGEVFPSNQLMISEGLDIIYSRIYEESNEEVIVMIANNCNNNKGINPGYHIAEILFRKCIFIDKPEVLKTTRDKDKIPSKYLDFNPYYSYFNLHADHLHENINDQLKIVNPLNVYSTIIDDD